MTMERPAILVLGAGGHGKAVLDLVLAHGGWRAAGLVDAAPRVAEVLGVPMLGDESALPALRQRGIAAAHPAIGANDARRA
uniref:PglD-related sugar-binding protein n=1 Tax=Neoroseomonas rubea TaxID=2748666 RepID=UPI0038CDA308